MSTAAPPAKRRKLSSRIRFVVDEPLHAEDRETALWQEQEVVRLADLSARLQVRGWFPRFREEVSAGFADS